MNNEPDIVKSGYSISKKPINLPLQGDVVAVRGISGRSRNQEERIAELEQRISVLEKWIRKKIAQEKENAEPQEDALVLRYGESVDKTTAAYILGVTRSTVYAMVADGRVQACSDGKRVSVRSISRYLRQGMKERR